MPLVVDSRYGDGDGADVHGSAAGLGLHGDLSRKGVAASARSATASGASAPTTTDARSTAGTCAARAGSARRASAGYQSYGEHERKCQSCKRSGLSRRANIFAAVNTHRGEQQEKQHGKSDNPRIGP